MKFNRKKFLKITGFATAGMLTKTGLAGNHTLENRTRVQKFNMHGCTDTQHRN